MQAPKPKEKIVEIKGQKYRLGKLDARSASYLAIKAAAALAPAVMGGGNLNAATLTTTLPNLPRKEFDEIQTMLLRTAMKLEDANGQLMPVPILREDGQFVDADMAYDVVTVMGLTVQAIIFNIGDFFGDAGLVPAKETKGA